MKTSDLLKILKGSVGNDIGRDIFAPRGTVFGGDGGVVIPGNFKNYFDKDGSPLKKLGNYASGANSGTVFPAEKKYSKEPSGKPYEKNNITDLNKYRELKDWYTSYVSGLGSKYGTKAVVDSGIGKGENGTVLGIYNWDNIVRLADFKHFMKTAEKYNISPENFKDLVKAIYFHEQGHQLYGRNETKAQSHAMRTAKKLNDSSLLDMVKFYNNNLKDVNAAEVERAA